MTRPTSRALLGLAAVAIGFAAADTYVVVLALPEMMVTAGLDIDQLQRAAPVVSGFLLGYVAVLPLIGRISDLRGRVPVLLASLVVFLVGSALTAAAQGLETIVIGRLVQGIGGGGLIPPTLALVADMWPPRRRGLPLGIISGVQELGSVVGPLYGAAVLSVGSWRDIFWLNTAVALVLVAALVQLRPTAPSAPTRAGRFDLLGACLAVVALIGVMLVLLEPPVLVRGVTSGLVYVPVAGESRWATPLSLTTLGVVFLFVIRQALARRPLLDWRGWGLLARQTDLIGAGLLAVVLGAVIIAFASADPQSAAISRSAPWLLTLAVAALAGFGWRQHTAANPLVPRGALRSMPAWGALAVSFFIGVALIAALVDIPFFARLTVHPDSQLDAALVLIRFLVALPIGAVLGGWLLHRIPASALTTVAMLMSAAAFWHMANWDAQSLASPVETISLVVAGLGFGLALAPVNAALLAHTADAVHGVASALLIVARMVGMLIGVSVLTAVGLQRFHAASGRIPSVEKLCDGAMTACSAYTAAIRSAGIEQLHAVFGGAAISALIAAGLAAMLLRNER